MFTMEHGIRILPKWCRAVLWFGDEEYEGLAGDYSMQDGIIKDGDGDVIAWRQVGAGNSGSDPTLKVVQEAPAGDVLWAKWCGNHRWWPACVCHNGELPPGVLKQDPKEPGVFAVRWLGSGNQYSWVDQSRVMPWEDHKEPIKKGSESGFSKALREGHELYQERQKLEEQSRTKGKVPSLISVGVDVNNHQESPYSLQNTVQMPELAWPYRGAAILYISSTVREPLEGSKSGQPCWLAQQKAVWRRARNSHAAKPAAAEASIDAATDALVREPKYKVKCKRCDKECLTGNYGFCAEHRDPNNPKRKRVGVTGDCTPRGVEAGLNPTAPVAAAPTVAELVVAESPSDGVYSKHVASPLVTESL